jgi:carboxylate-amine ligase
VLAQIDEDHRELIGPELYASEVELRSHPCPSAGDAVHMLADLRDMVRGTGATPLAAGLHPTAGPRDVALLETDRADIVRGEMRGLIERTPECALHVHIGMPDAETAVRVHDGLRAWLPLLCGLAASSPVWFGRDSGLASGRRALTRAYPGRGVPDPLSTFGRYEERLAAIASAGGPDDYTLLWWDLRLHPKLGTVELRELDAQPRLDDAAALAALIRGLARRAAENPGEPSAREPIEWSMFRAMRDGVGARIAHGERMETLAGVAASAVEEAMPYAQEAGDADALAGIARIVESEGSAARQRRALESGGAAAVVDLLRQETSMPAS